MDVPRHHPRRTPRLLLPLLLVLGLLLASPARANTVTIQGSPMTVHVNDVGGVTGRLSGDDSNVFYAPADNDSPSAGFNLGFPDGIGSDPSPVNYGSAGTPFTAVSQGTVAGAGTAANPYRVTTVYKASDGVTDLATVTQVARYVNGASRFSVSYAVQNVSASPLRFRAGEYADLYLAGSDLGTGFFDPGPPRLVGGFNATSGRVGGIEEVAGSPWDHFEEDHYGTVVSNLADLTASGLDNTVNPSVIDNGVAVQWDDFFASGLGAGSTASFTTVWTFTVGRLALSPSAAERPLGSSHAVTATLRNPDASVVAGEVVRYTISGANPSSGAVTTSGAGTAPIAWVGRAPGTDTVSAYADLNGSGTRDASEPGASATVHWIGAGASVVDNSIDAQLARLPAPRLGKAVNVAPVSGEVFVKLPAGAARAAQVKGRGFIPLREARQIPVGSLLDTRRGTVRLVSARAGGKRQQGDFNGGFFNALQSRRAGGLTELRMARASFRACTSSRRSGRRAQAARSKRVVRRLRGNAQGRFRTRGKYSAATVRGTDWTVVDRCDGTLTRVARGSVIVRDLRRRRSFVVRARRSRLVRAPG